MHCGLSPSRAGSVLCEGCCELEWGRRVRIKKEVIDKYGGSCACCGELNVMFLSIDHIHGGGTKERTETRVMGGGLYKKLRTRPVDPKYQVMCYNCNFARGNREHCPHKYMGRVQAALDWRPKPRSEMRRNRRT